MKTGPPSGWAIGFTTFAGVLMIMAGAFQALTGLVAIFENEFYVSTRNYLLQFDVTTWGWIHLLLGLLVLFAGFAVLSGQTWGRAIGITLAQPQRLGQLRLHPVLPDLVARDHRARRLRHLGTGGSRPRHHAMN
nr:hypothetical protein GCM10020092_080440 [Actinoplanes digitatis]